MLKEKSNSILSIMGDWLNWIDFIVIEPVEKQALFYSTTRPRS